MKGSAGARTQFDSISWPDHRKGQWSTGLEQQDSLHLVFSECEEQTSFRLDQVLGETQE
jgi:hypothetical protein